MGFERQAFSLTFFGEWGDKSQVSCFWLLHVFVKRLFSKITGRLTRIFENAICLNSENVISILKVN